jgi:hypothetical protein
MNPSNTWKGKLEAASFLPSKYLDRQCVPFDKFLTALGSEPGFVEVFRRIYSELLHSASQLGFFHEYTFLSLIQTNATNQRFGPDSEDVKCKQRLKIEMNYL